MPDMSTSAIELKLLDLFKSPRDVGKFVAVQELIYAQAARINELDTALAKAKRRLRDAPVFP